MDPRKKIQAGALVRAWALCLLKVHAKASCIFFFVFNMQKASSIV